MGDGGDSGFRAKSESLQALEGKIRVDGTFDWHPEASTQHHVLFTKILIQTQ